MPFVPALSLIALLAQTPVVSDSITVTGNASVRAKPDLATLQVGVVAPGVTALAAQSLANAKIAKVVAALQKIVADPDAFQTADAGISPVYAPPAKGQAPKIVGYRANETLSIRIRNVALTGRVLDAATASGATNVGGLSFGFRDDRAYRRKALALALEDARTKAESLVPGLRARIGRVIDAREGVSYGYTTNSNLEYQSTYDARIAPMSSALMAGSQTIDGTMTVRFELVPEPSPFGR